MVKRLLTIALGLLLMTGVKAQVTVSESDVAFWTGTGTNSTLVAIGWDDATASYTPTVVVWGVHWNGTITLFDALDTIATYDEHFTYTFSGSMLGTVSYIDPDAGVSLTPSMMWNCNSYGGAYGSTNLVNGTWLRISESTCSNYNFSTVNNIIYASDPNAAFSCLKAQAVNVTGLTATTATVNIIDTTYVNNYTVKLYAGDSLVDSNVIYTLTISYSTLTANTGYTVQVFSNCSDGTQTASRNATFRTPCVTIAHDALPWVEDFQSGTGSSYSTSAAFFSNHVFCWDLINPYSTSDPYINSSSSVNPAGGQCLYVSSLPVSPTLLILPPFEDTPDQLRLQFDVLSSYGHGFEAGVIDMSDSSFTPVATCLPTGSGWNHFEVTFAGITSGRLALRSNDNGPAYLDNVTVDELPSCVKPSQVLISNITASSADITITNPLNANHYMIYAAGDSVEIYSDSYTLNNLLPNTRYVVSVKTLCSDTTTGVTEKAFRTSCGAIAIPYHEDFSQFVDVARGQGNPVVDSTLPCWGFLKGRSLDRLELFPPTSSYGYGDDGYTMRIYGNYNDSRDIVVLPEFDQDINTLEMSLMARPYETGSFGGVLQIGYVTDATDSSTFVAVTNYPCSQFANGYDLCTSTFVDAPVDARIAIRYLPTGGSAKSWYIDDIDVHNMPACVRAQGISVNNIGTNGFTLHVADPTTVNHYRYYITNEGVVDSADFYDTVTTIAGLTPSTDYQLQVVSICDDGTLTLPHTIQASTLCGPVATLPFVENFEEWTATQSAGMNRCWNRLYKNSSNSLVTNNYPYCASGSANAYNGFKSLKMYSKGTSNDIKEYSVAYLPEFEANLNTLKVRFFYKYGGTTYNINKVKVAVGVSNTVADTTTFTRLATLTPAEIGWNEFEVELSGYTGTGNRITIMQTSTGTTAITSYIDSLVVDTISSCNRPATVAVSEVSAYGATLTWTDPSEAGYYIVRWSDGTNTDSATVSGATTYTLTSLTPSTNYTVDVRSICWGNPTAARTQSFATSCAPMPLPWEMNFDNITNINQLSSCWNRYNGLYNDATQSATLSTTTSGWTRSNTAFDGSSHVKVNLYGTSCKYWLVTPEINLTENAEMTFDYMLTKYDNANAPETGVGLEDDRFIILATVDSGTTWVPVAKWGSNTERDNYSLSSVTNTVSHATVSLSAFTGQVVRLAFYGESTVSGTDNDFRIDNLSVHAAASTPDTTPVTPLVLCNTIHTLPYTETFSGYTTDESIRVYYASAPQPECWTVLGNGRFTANYDTTATASIYFGGIGYATSINNYGCMEVGNPYNALIVCQNYDGTYQNAINNMRNYGTKRYAVLPAFDYPLSQTVLTFNHRTTLHSGAELRIGYIVNDTSDFVALDIIPADYRITHNDTIRFTQYAGIPADARLTLLWMSTDTAHTGDYPSNYYCGIDNIVVALDTTPDVPEPPVPVDSLTNADILFWVGQGSDSAIVIINWVDENSTPTTYAWGIAFDDDEGVVVSEVFDSLSAYDPRFYHSFSRYMGTIYNLSMVRFVDDNDSLYTITAGMNNYNCVKLDGVSIEGSDFEDEWINPGSLIEVSTDCYFNYGTVIPVNPPATAPTVPEDATIALSDIVYWVGEGSNSAALIVSYAQPDTAFAWGVHFNGSIAATDMLDSVMSADPRFWYVGNPSMGGDIRFIISNGDTLGLSPALPTETYGNYFWTNLNGTSTYGTTISDGDVLKYGDIHSGIGYDMQYGYYYQYAWTTVPTPVSVPVTDTTTPEPPVPQPVDATIAANDILFWVGHGSNKVVMAVNWADTALAWGYRFDSVSVTAQQVMDAIAAVDPRFSYTGTAYITDINYIDTAAGMTDTLGITPGNYWWSLLNHVGGWGLGDVLHNGDFYKWGDLSVAVVTDSTDMGNYMDYTYVWPYAIYPVTVPDTTNTHGPDPIVPQPGSFCGAVGTEGCNAIAADSSAFVAWATGVSVTRGPRNITNPDGPRAATGTESNAIGMATMNNVYDVVSLGDGGSALVTFARPIRNGEGPDFAVFENGFSDGSLELAFVEVSTDGERFVRFPATCLTQTETQLGNAGQTDPTNINNLAGKFRIGYGTPFDLEELRDSTGINIDSIVYVRVVDVVGSINPQYGTYDAYGHIINDPWPTPFEAGGFDLTGVGVIHELTDDTIIPQPVYYTVTLSANDSTWGAVSGAGTYVEGSIVEIKAIANDGYHFVGWNDNVSDSVRTIVVTADTSLVAIFAENTGIDDVTVVMENLWPNPTTDFVNVSVSHAVEAVLYDLTGRRMASFNLQEGLNTLDLTRFNAGVYMLRAEGAVSRIVKR